MLIAGKQPYYEFSQKSHHVTRQVSTLFMNYKRMWPTYHQFIPMPSNKSWKGSIVFTMMARINMSLIFSAFFLVIYNFHVSFSAEVLISDIFCSI